MQLCICLKCFIRYQPDEDPLGPKNVAIIITKNNVGLTALKY